MSEKGNNVPIHPPIRILRGLALGALALLAVIQIIPYGRSQKNPAVRKEPSWDSPQTRALARRACYDCHSNETHWPWYSHLAPLSWLVQHDVEEGRHDLNFSEWDTPQREAGEAARTVRSGDMPPFLYRLLHPHARLSRSEREGLLRGLEASLVQRSVSDPSASAPSPSAEEACVDHWLAERKLDPYGAQQGTMYAGGSPLFDEATGRITPRLDYVYAKWPDAKRACSAAAPARPLRNEGTRAPGSREGDSAPRGGEQ